jgi:hypothetical protein
MLVFGHILVRGEPSIDKILGKKTITLLLNSDVKLPQNKRIKVYYSSKHRQSVDEGTLFIDLTIITSINFGFF